MNKPVFRLELLQYVLGLDCRFSLDVLRAAMALALECAEGCASAGAPAANCAHAPAEAAAGAAADGARGPYAKAATGVQPTAHPLCGGEAGQRAPAR